MVRRAGIQRWLAAGLVLLAALGLPLSGLLAEPAPEGETRSTSLVAEERVMAGLHGYKVTDDLVAVARRHAERMAAQDRLHHNRNLGSEVDGWESVGENVGVGMTIDEIHQAFMASGTHRGEILSTTFTEVGVGVAPGLHGEWWVAQVFRKPMPAAAPRPAAAARPAPPAPPAPRPARTRAASRPATSDAAVPALAGAVDAGIDLEGLRTALGIAPVPLERSPDAAAAVTVPASPVLVRSERPADQRDVSVPVAVAASMLSLVVGGLTVTVAQERQRPSEVARLQRSQASMNWSRSPSSTAWTLPVS